MALGSAVAAPAPAPDEVDVASACPGAADDELSIVGVKSRALVVARTSPPPTKLTGACGVKTAPPLSIPGKDDGADAPPAEEPEEPWRIWSSTSIDELACEKTSCDCDENMGDMGNERRCTEKSIEYS